MLFKLIPFSESSRMLHASLLLFPSCGNSLCSGCECLICIITPLLFLNNYAKCGPCGPSSLIMFGSQSPCKDFYNHWSYCHETPPWLLISLQVCWPDWCFALKIQNWPAGRENTWATPFWESRPDRSPNCIEEKRMQHPEALMTLGI